MLELNVNSWQNYYICFIYLFILFSAINPNPRLWYNLWMFYKRNLLFNTSKPFFFFLILTYGIQSLFEGTAVPVTVRDLHTPPSGDFSLLLSLPATSFRCFSTCLCLYYSFVFFPVTSYLCFDQILWKYLLASC